MSSNKASRLRTLPYSIILWSYMLALGSWLCSKESNSSQQQALAYYTEPITRAPRTSASFALSASLSSAVLEVLLRFLLLVLRFMESKYLWIKMIFSKNLLLFFNKYVKIFVLFLQTSRRRTIGCLVCQAINYINN